MNLSNKPTGLPSSPARRPWLGLLLVLLLSCGLATWRVLHVRNENTRLKNELLQQREMTRALHGHLDTLELKARRPTTPQPPTISI